MGRYYSVVLFFQVNNAWLTCGSPGVRSGDCDGSNGTDNEQVELELHCGLLWWYWEKTGKGGKGQYAVYKLNGLVKGMEAASFVEVAVVAENQLNAEAGATEARSIAWALHRGEALCAQ